MHIALNRDHYIYTPIIYDVIKRYLQCLTMRQREGDEAVVGAAFIEQGAPRVDKVFGTPE